MNFRDYLLQEDLKYVEDLIDDNDVIRIEYIQKERQRYYRVLLENELGFKQSTIVTEELFRLLQKRYRERYKLR